MRTGGVAYTQSFDYDNRLTGVAGGSVNASFLYDADGTRVKGTVGGVSTVYLAELCEYQNDAVTKHYPSTRVGQAGRATRRMGYASDNGVFYTLSDHLRSTSVLVNRDGTVKNRNFYYPGACPERVEGAEIAAGAHSPTSRPICP